MPKKLRKFIRKSLIENFLNEEKKAMVLYHGSPYVFKEFGDRLTFFSDNENFAVDYAVQKSHEGAMDKEPNLYKVKVNTDIFNINNEKEFEELVKLLPDEIEFFPTNFPIPHKIKKDEILMNMRGFDILEPDEETLKAKVGDRLKTFDHEAYEVYKIDDEYVYGFSARYYNYILSDAFKDPLDVKVTKREMLEPFKEVKDYVKNLVKKYENTNYVSDNVLQMWAMSLRRNESYLVDLKDVSDDEKKKFFELYDKAKEDAKDVLIKLGYIKKFIKKPTRIELDETWRYFENETVMNIIRKLGYGGYVAKERKQNTYAIFNPKQDVQIIEYQLPVGFEFESIEEYKNYQLYLKKMYEKFGEKAWHINRWDVYKLFKAGVKEDGAYKELASKMNISEIIQEILEASGIPFGEPKWAGGITPFELGLILKDKLGFKKLEEIGEGTNGVAYSIGDNKVLKITTDLSEYAEAMKIKGKKNRHLADVYGVYRLSGKYKNLVIIISEYLKTDFVHTNDMDYILHRVFNELFESEYSYFNEFIQDYINGMISIKDFQEIKEELFSKENEHMFEGAEAFDYAIDFFNMLEEIRYLGITSADFGPTNFGYKKDGSLAYLDYGFGEEIGEEDFSNTLII